MPLPESMLSNTNWNQPYQALLPHGARKSAPFLLHLELANFASAFKI